MNNTSPLINGNGKTKLGNYASIPGTGPHGAICLHCSFLSMVGKNPGDWWEPDPYTETYVTNVSGRAVEATTITFPTGVADLTAAGRQKLEKFVGGWVDRRFGG